MSTHKHENENERDVYGESPTDMFARQVEPGVHEGWRTETFGQTVFVAEKEDSSDLEVDVNQDRAINNNIT